MNRGTDMPKSKTLLRDDRRNLARKSLVGRAS